MSHGNTHILPDSRLSQRPDLGCFMADWELPDGSTVRIEVQPVFCANCGVPYGYVPKENTAFAFWLCNQCFEQYGAIVGTYAQPDEQFNRDVAEEIMARFGKHLTDAELGIAVEMDTLGTTLKALEKDSPYPKPS